MPHPTIVSESGRAVVAHHSMLVMDILGVGEFESGKVPETAARRRPPRGAQPARRPTGRSRRKNLLEAYHDALEYREEALSLFALGRLSLTSG